MFGRARQATAYLQAGCRSFGELEGMFGRARQATAYLQAGCRSFGELERCSRACQSVAQLDQRRLAVNPACFEGHVWKSAAGNGMSTGRVQDLWSARALLKRVSERCSDRPARRLCQERKTACVQ